ncbi:MAG: hypothetical protein NC343_00945 [Muribaculum sp.]|nr:hypothetical protein [Muribaculaceae bacterium]MCM1080302.1 hypothetical protein [Muribaculum sp.]
MFILLCCLAIVAPLWLTAKPESQQPKPESIIGKTYPIKPTVPTADRHTPGRVFLERADRLWMDERIDSNYQVLTGNVQFRKEDMFMFCDSAHFYDKESSFDAFGNVRMEQGDTLFVFAAELNYDGPNELATFIGNSNQRVRLINRDVELTTDLFYYDIANNLGYYNTNGTIADAENLLSSVYGQYSPDTKEAEFRVNVVLNDRKEEKFRMTTERLLYNTDTHIARIVSPSVIVTDSATVYSSNGWYDTENGKSELYDRSRVVTPQGNTLTGDTLFYDNISHLGEAFGNMVLTDSARSSAIEGNYGIYFQDLDSAVVTGRARALEYSRADTLFMHGDTIRGYMLPNDSSHVVTAYPRVRFWRIDMQGLCDSMSFMERDSILYMHRHPIVWNGERQVFGNIIQVHLNDSTVDWAKLPDFAFVAEHIDEEFYNQLTGKELLAQFVDGQLSQLEVSGNVEVIMLPQENDSTYNKIIRSESSFLKANFVDQKLKRLAMWPEVTGNVTPLYLARRANCYLAAFKWYESLRPKDKDDIFNVPPEMVELMKGPELGTRRRISSVPKTEPQAVQPSTDEPAVVEQKNTDDAK